MSTKLEIVALAIQKHEGYFPPSPQRPAGSLSYRNNNPGNLVFGPLAQSFGATKFYQHPTTGHQFAIFPTYTDGFAALKKLIENACTGKSTIYRPDMSILEFFSKYSPVRNSAGIIIPNVAYASAVAKDLGVSVNAKIKTLIDQPNTDQATIVTPSVVVSQTAKPKIVLPLDKIVITQEFGTWPEHYRQYGLAGHNGMDFRTRFIDTPLAHRYAQAVMDGVVVEVVNQGKAGYGLYVRLRHRGNEETIYAHLSKTYVRVGEKVSAGKWLGVTGNTGASTGSHLHFGWRPDGYNYANGFKGWENPRKLFGNLLTA